MKFGRKFKLAMHQQDQVRTMLHKGQPLHAIARHSFGRRQSTG
ncbi:helix-turn-helix domain-containing protein [Roseobacter fucihabitans]